MKKVLSILLSALMLASFASIAFAADDAITVDFSAYAGSLVVPYGELAVTDGLAEQYGFTMPEADHNDEDINQPTVLDAIVAAHVGKYGAAFTAETAADYLEVDSLGKLTKAFGVSVSEDGAVYTVNGAIPYDDVLQSYSYNGVTYNNYTIYNVNEARIGDGDTVALYCGDDSYYYYAAWFESSAAIGSEVTVGSDAVVLTLKGVNTSAFSAPQWQNHVTALAGVDVYASKDGGAFAKVGTTDANGQFSVPTADAGVYVYAAYGALTENEYATPAFYLIRVKAAPAEETDTSAAEENLTLWQKIVAFFKRIFDFFKNIFRFGR